MRTFTLVVCVSLNVFGAVARAQTVPLCTPNITNCQNPRMYKECWPADYASCQSIISSAFQADNQANPNQRLALAPPGTTHAGQTVPAKYYAFDPVASHLQLIGATDGYHGSALNHRAWVRNPQLNGNVVYHWFLGRRYATHVDPQASWANDGQRSSSCEEWIYKRYRSMSNYEDFVAGVDSLDYLSLLRGAYMTNLIYQGNVTDEGGNDVLDWSLPAHAKNIYFELPIDNLPLQTFEYDPGIIQVLRAVGSGPSPEIPTDPNGLWGFVTTQINTFGGDLLEQRYGEMKHFREVMRQRAQLVAMDPMNTPTCQSIPWWPMCQPLHNAIVQLIYYADQEINQMLESALTQNCLYRFGPTACDISPHQLVDELHAAIDAQREPEYQQCLRLTGNQFGTNSLVARVSAGSLASVGIPAGDYPGNSLYLTWMLWAIGQKLSAVNLPVDPHTGNYTLGNEKSDYQSWGSDWFGADYSYDAAWHVTDLAAPNQICNANLHMNASLTVNGSILTKTVPVVDFMAAVDTSGTNSSNNSVRAQSHFTLLGNNIYTPVDQTQPLNFNLALGGVGTGDQQIWSSPPIDIPVGPIQVFVSGGISGGVGVDGGMSGGLSRDCNANTIGLAANSNLQPYAHLEGFAQAALGVPSVLEVGVRGSVTLIRASLPLNAGLNMALDGTGQVTLSGSSSLYLNLSTFGGQISVFLDSLIGSTEKELISWKGVELSQKLFDLSFAKPILVSLIQLKLAEPPGSGAL